MANRDRITPEGEKFLKTLEELNKLEVRVGYQQGENSENGVDLADIAMFNELGTVHIPSRPFLRDSVNVNEEKINSFLQSMKQVILHGGTAEDVLEKIGTFQKGLIQELIPVGNFEPNSEATIHKKGSDVPLIDIGLMRQSVNFVIKKKGESD